MTLACVLSRGQFGIEAPPVRVEVHLGSGLPAFTLVGLPETIVRESRDRVRAAVQTAGFDFPDGRLTVNLAPADLPKEGGRFDLPIALGVLVASAQLPATVLADTEFFGELGLNGELRSVRGMLAATCHAARAGHRVVLPAADLAEARHVTGAEIAAAAHLLAVTAHCTGSAPLEFATATRPAAVTAEEPDLADVKGQWQARRALEIAAAGSHSLLLIGPPGTGKSMLAHRLGGLLPPLDDERSLEVAMIASLGHGSGYARAPLQWGRRPFRAPHHTASVVALVGGGRPPRPGEITLAHRGVLFLDELPEFGRQALEGLREPLETGRVTIARAAQRATFPAQFQLVAAMNPCPCGFHGEADRCRCSPAEVRRYFARLSGPLLDRIDLQVRVARVPYEDLRAVRTQSESSAEVAGRVAHARERQRARRQTVADAETNATLSVRELDRQVRLEPSASRLLGAAAQRFELSARACHRVLRVARTIADLAASDAVMSVHVAEALDLRRLDRASEARGDRLTG
jgi:magnesium chelatase family protein